MATRKPTPSPPDLDALKISPEVGWYLESRGIPFPEVWQAPLWKTPEPRDLEGAVFDPDRVDRVLAAFRNLVHTQGRWAGRPLEPAPWQVAYFLAPVFGWVRFDDEAGCHVRVARKAYVDVSRKNGKALDVDTPILTDRGWLTMGDVKVGDFVHAPDGSLTRVAFTSEVFTDHDCFEVRFADGQTVVADGDHLWGLHDRRTARDVVVSSAELAGQVSFGARGDRRYRAVVPEPLRRPTASLPVDPYLLGVWLGDGATAGARVTSADPEIISAFAAAGFNVRHIAKYDWGISGGLLVQLRALGVLGNKHVPDAYMDASAEQRLALLRGLMDTDGTVILGNGVPRCEFTSTSRCLASAALQLARSLGWKATLRVGRAKLNGRDCGEKYRVGFNAYSDRSPFALQRKTARLLDPPTRAARSRTNALASVTRVASRPTRCIQVEHPSSMFLVGEGFLPTHNTTIAGGVAIYLTAADGEQGAQVLAVAAAKEQARYCFQPVKQLAENSPKLKPYVKPFASKIVHNATGSTFSVVASVGDLIHGANIHGAVIDELHVHKTRDVVDAVETGTGARDQPLIVIITTPDDGKPGTIYAERRKYVEQLARGAIVDFTQYGVVWAVAESEAELRRLGLDPFSEEAQRKANPGYGVSPTKAFLKSEAAAAKETPAALARYLRLHLGIRTKQATRYIRLEDWDLSEGLVDETLLAGRECHGGLDLASVNDVAALCWLFPDRPNDTYTALWRFFLPEDRLADLNRRTAGAADAWVREGILTTTPGAVLDTASISTRIDADAQVFKVKTIGYDRWGANDVTKKAGEAGLTMVGVGQGYGSLSAPLKETLRLVLVKRLHHGGNPMMRWMVDNLAVAMDPQGNVKPDKAAAADKIDGVSALVTALKECQDAELEETLPPPQAANNAPTGPQGNFWRNTQRLSL